MSNQSGNQLVLDTSPKTMADVGIIIQKIQRWANTQVVNRITNVDDAFSIPILGREGTGIVTVDTGSGGYASLTGPGETTTPGDLTQLGGFTVTDIAAHGFTFSTALGQIFLNTFSGGIGALLNIDGDFVDFDLAGPGAEWVTVIDDTDPTNDIAVFIQNLGYGAIWITSVFGSGAIGAPIVIDAGSFPNPAGPNPPGAKQGLVLNPSNGNVVVGGTGSDLGFYGATPVPQAAAPTTLAQVITILTNLGLCA